MAKEETEASSYLGISEECNVTNGLASYLRNKYFVFVPTLPDISRYFGEAECQTMMHSPTSHKVGKCAWRRWMLTRCANICISFTSG